MSKPRIYDTAQSIDIDPEDTYAVLDLVGEYITTYDLNYVAKENRIYSYESDTDSTYRAKWKSSTPIELRRILSTMKGLKVSLDELIHVFQELGRVYERTADSEQETRSGVFNLALHPCLTKQELVIDTVIRRLNNTGTSIFLFMQVRKLYLEVFKLLEIDAAEPYYANWITRRFCRYHKFRLREYQDRPYLHLQGAEPDEKYDKYRFKRDGVKRRPYSLLQRLDSPNRKVLPKDTYKMEKEYMQQIAKSVVNIIQIKHKDLPSLVTLGKRRRLMRMQTRHNNLSSFKKEQGINIVELDR